MRSSFFSCRKRLFLSRLRHFRGFDLFPELRSLLRQLVAFAEFALNRLELLAQVKLSLRTIDISACLSIDFLLDSEDFDLLVQEIVDASQTCGGVGNIQN